MANWSELPNDILIQIPERLPVVSHRLRFHSVCTSWQWIELHSRRFRPPLEIPGLIIQGTNPESRFFYSVSEEKVYKTLSLPLPLSLKCLVAAPGWVLTMDAENFDTALFNPSSQTKIPLPPINKLMDGTGKLHQMASSYYSELWKAKAVPSCDPLDTTANYNWTVMISHSRTGKLAFARPGDESWTLIVKKIGRRILHGTDYQYGDIVFSRGHFYAIDAGGMFYRCDIGGTEPKMVVVSYFPAPRISHQLCDRYRYLVESMGDVFAVTRSVLITEKWHGENRVLYPSMEVVPIACDFECRPEEEGDDPESRGDWDIEDGEVTLDHSSYKTEDHLGYKTIHFEIYKLDMGGRKWVRVKSLDNRAFFVGWNTSFSVSPQNTHGFKPNCIYFADDNGDGTCAGTRGGHDNGVFCVEDGNLEHFLSMDIAASQTLVLPPQWLTLFPS